MRKPAEGAGWCRVGGMKLPEWRPIPPEWKSDDDSKDVGAALYLIVGPLLFILGVGLVVFALVKLFA